MTDEILLRDEFSGDSWKLEVKLLVIKLNFFVTVLLMDEEKVLRPFDSNQTGVFIFTKKNLNPLSVICRLCNLLT